MRQAHENAQPTYQDPYVNWKKMGIKLSLERGVIVIDVR
jgi:hypothetical protein